MGTLAAGRWKTPGRKTVESCPVLDVNQLSAMGYLLPGWAGSWVLGSNGAGGVVSINTYAEARQLNLSWPSYIVAGEGQDGEVTERISIVQVPSNLGRGSLPYFICPGEGGGCCGRRVRKLYLARRYFLCRHCVRLLYASQSEPPWQRTIRRANTLRQRLDRVAAGVGTPLPGKSRPVWAPAYARLLEEALQAEMQAYDAGTERLQWIVDQIEARRNRHSSCGRRRSGT